MDLMLVLSNPPEGFTELVALRERDKRAGKRKKRS